MWQLFTQVTLIALLWGPNSGGLSLMGDVAQVMCDRAFGNPPNLNHWLGSSSSGSGSPQAAHLAAPAGAVVAAGNASLALGNSPAAAVAAADGVHSSSSMQALLASSSNGGGLAWLLNGQTMMVLMTVFAVFPLSCQKHMRSLETAAGAGLVIVAGLCALLAYKAVTTGWPAVADGQFPLWSLKVRDDCCCVQAKGLYSSVLCT